MNNKIKHVELVCTGESCLNCKGQGTCGSGTLKKAADSGYYTMNMVCSNCEGHSIMAFKLGEPCKQSRTIKTDDGKKSHEEVIQYLCPHCGCVTTRATTRAAGI